MSPVECIKNFVLSPLKPSHSARNPLERKKAFSSQPAGLCGVVQHKKKRPRRDCLGLLALNVSPVECIKNFVLSPLKPSHSARNPLERKKAFSSQPAGLCGVVQHKKKTAPARFERAIFGLGNRCSILLSYEAFLKVRTLTLTLGFATGCQPNLFYHKIFFKTSFLGVM